MILDSKSPLDVLEPGSKSERSDPLPNANGSRGWLWGLLWCEWFAHSRLLLGFSSSGWWAFGRCRSSPIRVDTAGRPAYALTAGAIYGGGDTIEGCEEFSFSLPATRADRYLARLAVGGGTLLVITAMDLLALGLDLPQFLARVYIDAGLLKPLPVIKPHLLYGLVFAFPFAVFSLSFSVAAVSHSRMLIVTAWLWSLLTAMAITHLAFRYEEYVWSEPNGFCSAPGLMMVGLGALWGGYRAYLTKEVGQHVRPLTLPPKFWLWLVTIGLGMALVILLVTLLAKQYPHVLAQ